MDSTSSNHIATALGIRLNYAVDIMGRGSSTEALVDHEIGLLEAGRAEPTAVSVEERLLQPAHGRSGPRRERRHCCPRRPVQHATRLDDSGAALRNSATHHPRDTPPTTRAFAEVAVAHRYHASLNLKAAIEANHHRGPSALAMVAKPFRLLDCCQETDVSAAMWSRPRARLRPAPSAGFHHGR